MFAALPSDSDTEDEMDDDVKVQDSAAAIPAPKVIKPPPIFIPDVKCIKKLTNMLVQLVGSDSDFTCKSTRDSNVRVMMPDKESYSAVKKHLDAHNIRYHTFQPRDERAYRIVIEGLHHSMNHNDVKEALLALGHGARDIHNPVSRNSKLPLSGCADQW
ncbi:hypothetical protein KR018_005990 [Drosophila ironensis]|nr:hypothetical protein KR018_005990 [Drosophila ironensis]